MISELLLEINIDGNDIEQVRKLANDYTEWCNWNKNYNTIEVKESNEFDVIIVVHDLFDFVKVTDGWEMVSDIKYFLRSYALQSEEDCRYLVDFWKNKVV